MKFLSNTHSRKIQTSVSSNLKTSPFINKEINRLALQFLEYGAFGTRSCPDMLAITYYAGNYRGNMHKEYTREIQDTYYQLDKDLEQLLDKIDKKVGLEQHADRLYRFRIL